MPPKLRPRPGAQSSAREPDFVEVTGAREHNLAIDHLAIPKRQLVVFTGPSGSGKSSLAFDTLYAEGQRRYVETLSAYARQFLGQLDRPKVDHLRGLSPTIAIEQKSASSNPRSTVGTITEIYDYLRVLYAKVGEQHCPTCGKRSRRTARRPSRARSSRCPRGTKLTLLAPLVAHRKGEFRELFARSAGARLRARRGRRRIATLEETSALDKKKKHTLALVVDRVVVRPSERARIAEAVELALREGKGELRVVDRAARDLRASARRARAAARVPGALAAELLVQLAARHVHGCTGLGKRDEVNPELVVPDPSKSIRRGAIAPWASAMARGEGWTARIVDGVARAFAVDLDVPWKKLPKAKQRLVLHGAEAERGSPSAGGRRGQPTAARGR